MLADDDSNADRFFDELLDAVDQQLRSPATAYVRKTYERLLKEGLDDRQAREVIAGCLAEESDRMLRSQRPFDQKSYRALLDMTKPGEGPGLSS